jgi:hypothetical protein
MRLERLEYFQCTPLKEEAAQQLPDDDARYLLQPVSPRNKVAVAKPRDECCHNSN